MKRYERYKDSDVQWIGEIPEHWEVKRAKFMFNKEKREVRDCDDVVTCFRDGQVTLRKNRRTTGFTESLTEIGYQGVRKGDLVIHQMDAFAGSIGVSDSDGKGTSVYHCCTPKGAYNVHYYANLIRRMAGSGFIQSLYRGIRERSSDFKFPVFGNQYLVVPSTEEQHAIVGYLKDKTLKIDQYVAARERERELLDSLKQSEIANIVTKGLNPNAPMKDSGIPWIGLIPEHWEVKKIRTCFKERREKVSDKDYEALSVSKLGVTPQLDSAVKTDNGDNRKKVCKGDFVVNSRSDRKGSCGFSEYEGSVSLINIVLTPFNVFGRYYHYLFRSNDYIEEFYRQGRGIVADLWTTRYSEMKNIYIPVPPLSEQQAIVTYIDKKLAKIDRCLADLQAEIDYLKEFKQRLISDAVTGQICVAEPQKGEKS
jgi:type I restriction enzyme, S subunit